MARLLEFGREEVAAACGSAALEVLEAMFFEIPEEDGEAATNVPDGAVLVSAEFRGDLQGVLRAAVDPHAAISLSANFLGREDPATITAAEMRLVACELANMVCGNALSRIMPHGNFRIATPEVGAAHPEGGEWRRFALESGAASFSLEVEPG